MGAWDVGIFDDDVALDVKSVFEEAMEEGLNIKQATKFILEEFEDELEFEDDAVTIYLALAALQLEKGEVLKEIKQKALEVIESGIALESWEEDKQLFENRKNVLEELRLDLTKIK